MSALSSSRITPPKDWQAFERASEVLWTQVLGSEVNMLGVGGQEQHGVDLTGYRNGDIDQLVGVQCKCKKPGVRLTEKDVRTEVEKALKYDPPLKEFILTTTAQDDAKLQMLCQKLAAAQHTQGRAIIIRIEGWETLERRIARYPEAINAFDPSYGPWGRGITNSLEALHETSRAGFASQQGQLEVLTGTLTSLALSLQTTTDATASVASAVEKELDAAIDDYRDRLLHGKPQTALTLLEALFARLKPETSDRIRFRIKANIGHCHLGLGDDTRAAAILMEAVSY